MLEDVLAVAYQKNIRSSTLPRVAHVVQALACQTSGFCAADGQETGKMAGDIAKLDRLDIIRVGA